VDVVVTDMYMPGVDGMDVIMRLRSEIPDARFIAISGGGFVDSAHALEAARSAGAVRTLAKPFTREQFLQAAADSLSTR
jgi:CheY-like chemotaxis protein